MRNTRHAHPHIDPRQPRQQSQPGTNPPVFAWKPGASSTGFCLKVARDAAFKELVLHEKALSEPVFLPERAFAPGRYFWQWSAGDDLSEIFSFEINAAAAQVEVPAATEILRRFGDAHPRCYIRPEQVAALRQSRNVARAEAWQALEARALELLDQPHALAEPPFLPDKHRDYGEYFRVWYGVMVESRRFMIETQTLALAYLTSGESRFARAACQRLASVALWNPDGSSHLKHNDEAHMSLIWHGPQACDWVWDQFTAEERARVIEQFRRRGQITYEHMHGHGSYGVTRFDSHAGREIVFLGLIALVFHEEIPEGRQWLEWLRPVLCGIWPIWAGDDGGWEPGPSYGLAYVTIMTQFATALKRGAGVDLYRRPFWKNHARWRQHCVPAYAEWVGFGDHTERWPDSWTASAELVELIARETGASEHSEYVAALRRAAPLSEPTPPERRIASAYAQNFLAPLPGASAPGATDHLLAQERRQLHVFQAAGLASIRTHPDDETRDLALLFRSSPFGSISHSHANNNDFILHVAGKVLAMPSGYYDGYGSPHHDHWVHHTKSHNCVTLSDAPQIMKSPESCGAIEHTFEDERLVYFLGRADASYRDRARRCRRHVMFLKTHNIFFLIDDFEAAPIIRSALQWNLHSWAPFDVDEQTRSFTLQREGSALQGHFLYYHNAFFSLSEGWDPPVMNGSSSPQWKPQYHLRFTPAGLCSRTRLGVLLCPAHALLSRAQVQTERCGEAEGARLGDDFVFVNQAQTAEYRGLSTHALAALRLQGCDYTVSGEGGISRSS